jgi:hypothetical protein
VGKGWGGRRERVQAGRRVGEGEKCSKERVKKGEGVEQEQGSDWKQEE